MIGYQHAVLFRDKSLYHDHGRGTVPDHIFATGDVTRDILARNMKFCQGQITTLAASNVKHRHQKCIQAPMEYAFAPEGTLEEVHIMAKIAFDAAVLYPSQLFVLRLHPVIVRSDIETMIAAWPSTPPNFTLSAAPLNDDLMAASWICYRGSTVAFQVLADYDQYI